MNASLTYVVEVLYQDIDKVATVMENIDISPDVEGIQPPISICEDITAINGRFIERTVKYLYSAEFEDAYPTVDLKEAALKGVGKNIIANKLPARVDVIAAQYELNDCP